MTDLPTRRLRVIDTENAVAEIEAFAQRLVDEGERPWFEVHYPRPTWFEGTDAEWHEAQRETFDAVELVDGEIVTLPPYEGSAS